MQKHDEFNDNASNFDLEPTAINKNVIASYRSTLTTIPSIAVIDGIQRSQERDTFSSVSQASSNRSFCSYHDKSPLLSTVRWLWGSSGNNRPVSGLATFPGVFCPVSLSMLSVLLYLRLGLVVGQAGVLLSLVVLTLAYSIILLTSLSLCAVSTNGAIEGGGVYYMISRALGPEFGGAIGMLFFVANIFSCALSLSGLSEVMINNFGPGGFMAKEIQYTLPTGSWYHFGYALCISLVTLFVCLVGASLFAKTSLITLVVVTFTYVTFLVSQFVQNYSLEMAIPKDNPSSNLTPYFNYTGFSVDTFKSNLYSYWTQDYTTGITMTFASVFGVVFSGVTGLMAGANMSGDLAKPNVSIPIGTLQATIATFLIYCLTALVLSASCSRELLLNDYTVIQNINIWPPFIFLGIFATSLASGMSNLIGASRVLNRIAEDRLFGFILKPFLKTVCQNNPLNAVIFSWLLVVCVLLIGVLNTIAQVTSVFFLLSYAGVNLACLALDLTSAPNFRPTFKYFNWQTAFLGFLCSLTMMFMINSAASGIAIISLLLLIMGLHLKAPPVAWGSISQALIFHQVRKYLLILDTRKEHVKYWRPQVLLLIENPKSCLPLIDFVNDLKKSGLYILGHVKIENESNSHQNDRLCADPVQEESPYWLSLVDYLKVKAFVDITVAKSVRDGIQHLVRLSGLGALKPNTIILGFLEETPKPDTFRNSRLMLRKKHPKYAKLGRSEVVEFFTGQQQSLPSQGNFHDLSVFSDFNDSIVDGVQKKLNCYDFVAIIQDILCMNKNLCLARHFHKLDKDVFERINCNSDERYIDVWPLDLLKPLSSDAELDNSCLFLLQLACILSMVDVWKSKTKLRVFLCVTSLQDMQSKEIQLKAMLSNLRIEAKSILLPWDHVICHYNRSMDNNFSRQNSTFENVTHLSYAYLSAFNDLLQKNSGKSAVVFLNLPLPFFKTDEQASLDYLKRLKIITDNLPPVLLVHGLSSVISTAL